MFLTEAKDNPGASFPIMPCGVSLDSAFLACTFEGVSCWKTEAHVASAGCQEPPMHKGLRAANGHPATR